MLVIASAAIALANCTQQQVKPIEVKGPLVDTPQQWSRPAKRPISAPAAVLAPKPSDVKVDDPSSPGSDADLNKRLDDIGTNVKALHDTLKQGQTEQNKETGK